jgi:23S rRNA (cytidine1920-2'-O)/16S rRNA (cytidine1409-2'-O)-methyltransferase
MAPSGGREPRAKRVRLDQLLVDRGLVESRNQAQALILAGNVRVGDTPVTKAGTLVPMDSAVTLAGQRRFVSRGGEKLAHALSSFQIDVTGLLCADFGASTGGFTDCLLQGGAARVYAIDVGYGQLDYRLQQDSRVIVMDRTNARYLESLPEPIALVVMDVSFISLALVLPAALRVLAPAGRIVALIKPQFEAGKEAIGKGGVVRDVHVHRAVLQSVTVAAGALGLHLDGLTASPLRGPAGNIEFLAAWHRGAPPDAASVARMIDDAIAAAPGR